MRFICFLGLFTLLLTGCKKPSEADDPKPETACKIERADYGDGFYALYRFDATGKLTGSTLTYQNEDDKIAELPITYEYNSAGNLIKSNFPGGSDEYTYDGSGVLTKVEFKDKQGQVGERFIITTDAQKRITQIKTIENIISTYTYDNNGSVTKIEVFWENMLIDRTTYEYDQSSTAKPYTSVIKGHPFSPALFTNEIVYYAPLNLTGRIHYPVKGKYETQYNEDWDDFANSIRTYFDYTSVFKLNSQNFIVEESTTDRISNVTNTIKYKYSNCN